MTQGTPGEAIYADVRPVRRRRRGRGFDVGLGLAAAAAVVLVGALSWWYRFGAHTPVMPVLPDAPVVEPAAPAAAPPAIRHPIRTDEAPTPPARWRDALAQGLAEVLGRAPLPWPLAGEGVARRFVATVDNLDRVHASATVWPVAPAAGRLLVERAGEDHVIAAANAARYEGFVRLLEQADIDRAVGLYARLYPLFQRAYEDLGYPGRYFNDRLVDIVDHLLATPVPQEPVAVRRIDVRGPMDLAQPWRHYEFVDPGLQTLSAGQKLLVRMGPAHAARVKARLQALRDALVRQG